MFTYLLSFNSAAVPPYPPPPPPFSPPLMSLMVSVDVKHHVHLQTIPFSRRQETRSRRREELTQYYKPWQRGSSTRPSGCRTSSCPARAAPSPSRTPRPCPACTTSARPVCRSTSTRRWGVVATPPSPAPSAAARSSCPTPASPPVCGQTSSPPTSSSRA